MNQLPLKALEVLHNTTTALAVDPQSLIGKKPNKSLIVPPEFRRATLKRESDGLINDIKIDTNCVVIAHWTHGKIDRFDLFGSGHGVENATRRLNQWIYNAHKKSKESSAWAKTSAFDFDEWYYNQVDEWEDVRKQKFKGPLPEPGLNNQTLFKTAIGWPEDLHNEDLTPRYAFGNKLEALDGLRMQDEVYIILNVSQNGLWQLEVLSYNPERVEMAQGHLQALIDKIRAEKLGQQHPLNLILDYREGVHVELQRCEPWWPNISDKIVPHLVSSGIMDERGSYRAEGVDNTQLSKIQRSIRLALENVRRRRGAYDFQVRLGGLVLSSKQVKDDKIGKTFPTDKFLREVNGMIELDVKKWLANADMGDCILRACMLANELLEPAKSSAYFGCTPKSLEQTRPTFRGTWVFREPSSAMNSPREPPHQSTHPKPMKQQSAVNTNSLTTLFVVQIDWTEDEEGLYEKGIPKFFKVEPGKAGPKTNIDVTLLELGESRGWHFALESLVPLPKKIVSPVLLSFADGVMMKPGYNIASRTIFATWLLTPTVKRSLHAFRLEKIYTFGIQKTGYKAELTEMWYPGQTMPVWGLGVRHDTWALHLAQLERLSVGGNADWDNSISTFFPDDGYSDNFLDNKGKHKAEDEEFGLNNLSLDSSEIEETPRHGVRILLNKLMQLSTLVSSVDPDAV